MPLDDDLSLAVSDEELARRKVLALLGAGALSIAGVGTAITSFRFLEPSVFYEEDARVVVGRPDDIPPGTVLVIAKHKLYVVRTAEGFYALSSVCTHLGCMTRYVPEDSVLACPCHGSRFSLDGRVAAGPAPHPLRRLQITIERGVLVVDSSKQVAADAVFKVA
jgi:cytochrome b6-f complex iron-sulfur subunit